MTDEEIDAAIRRTALARHQMAFGDRVDLEPILADLEEALLALDEREPSPRNDHLRRDIAIANYVQA
jgi:hypothetical protein